MKFVELLQSVIPMPASDLFIALATVVLFLPAVVIINNIFVFIHNAISSLFGRKANKTKAN